MLGNFGKYIDIDLSKIQCKNTHSEEWYETYWGIGIAGEFSKSLTLKQTLFQKTIYWYWQQVHFGIRVAG